jgi:NitT/TauT family transport system ATP-binding protein
MEIAVENLSKQYHGVPVLSGFNAVFPDGKTTCIMGPSGCGKTTLLRILMGLEPADSGNVKGMSGRKISAVFQDDRLCENLSA